ncbi:MAG TPA: archaemetzincin family Zn-dependent metalloprotease [Nitrososphaeraceae archaeon]|nr:archaemetzincin family Zn-dependent metalloprotease [Nitrososphaeraceae archaeon]
MQIVIQSIGWHSSEIEYYTTIVSPLIRRLSKIFGDKACINSGSLQSSSSLQSSPSSLTTMPPTHLFDKARKQWISDSLLDWLLETNEPDITTKVLAICDFDAYSDELNFVFGEAHLGGRVAAIYLPKLREEFYVRKSDKNNKNLFEQRVIKEAVHELGHTFGLRHCQISKCVMHFSNSLQDTDFKDDKLCEKCNKILAGKLSG